MVWACGAKVPRRRARLRILRNGQHGPYRHPKSGERLGPSAPGGTDVPSPLMLPRLPLLQRLLLPQERRGRRTDGRQRH
eukprot:3929721-Alexandrium_andersonii.AAC.1